MRTSARRPCYKSVVVLGLTGVTSFSGPISSQDLAVSKGQRSKVIATLTGMLLNSIGSRLSNARVRDEHVKVLGDDILGSQYSTS